MTLNERARDIGGGLLVILVAQVIFIASAALIAVPDLPGFIEVACWVTGIFGLSLTVLGWILGALALRAGLRKPTGS